MSMLPRWITSVIRHFSFYGRLPRKEFWKLYAVNSLFGIVALFFSIDALSFYLTGKHLLVLFVFGISTLPHFLVSPEMADVFMFLGAVALSALMVTLFSLLSFLVRRLHDINLSAWTLLLFVFVSPVILWLLVTNTASHFSTSLFLYVIIISALAGLIGCIPGSHGRNTYGDDPLSLESTRSSDSS